MALEIQDEEQLAKHIISLEEQLKRTSEEVQKLAERQQRTEESLQTISEKIHNISEKLAEPVSTRKVVGYYSDSDYKSFGDILADAVCDYAEGITMDELKELKDDVGRIFVEFDGAVWGEIDGDTVLVLIQSNDYLKQADVDLAACSTLEEEKYCLPTRASLYEQAYNGLIEDWKKTLIATKKHKYRLNNQSLHAQMLRKRSAKLVFAVGSRDFPESLQEFCKTKGYWCIVKNPSGDGYEVKR